MNLRIELPSSLEQVLKLRAAEAGKDVESFVVDSIRETLGEPEAINGVPGGDFREHLLRRPTSAPPARNSQSAENYLRPPPNLQLIAERRLSCNLEFPNWA